MARIKYYNTKTGKWEYADSSFVVGGNGSGGNVDVSFEGETMIISTANNAVKIDGETLIL